VANLAVTVVLAAIGIALLVDPTIVPGAPSAKPAPMPMQMR
jgi:hypothetical protein